MRSGNAAQAREQFMPAAGLLPGVYFNLDEEAYHADPALGSSDIRAMRADLEAWWRGSRFNPDAGERKLYEYSSTARKLGTAMHKLVLEGREAFERIYVRRPDDPPYASASDKGVATKRFNATLMSHQHSLKGDEWDLCERTGRLIERHPDLATAFVGGMREVSVFWVRPDGIRCKARFDLLKAGGVGDLKSIENERRWPLDAACVDQFLRYRYDIQAEHYLEGRAAISRGVLSGRAFMVTDQGIEPVQSSNLVTAAAARELIDACASTDFHYRANDGGTAWYQGNGRRYAFQFVFVQKAVPGVFSFIVSPGNGYLDDARQDIELALRRFRAALAQGLDQPPPLQWRLGELAHEEAPAWWAYRR